MPSARFLIPAILCATPLAFGAPSHAQGLALGGPTPSSFSCARAQTKVERFLCDPNGDAWNAPYEDRQLDRVYRAALRRAADPRALVATQRQWLRQRDAACAIPSPQVNDDGASARQAAFCLAAEYERRRKALEPLAALPQPKDPCPAEFGPRSLALRTAVANGDLPWIRLAASYATHRQRNDALVEAVRRGAILPVRLLVTAGADPNGHGAWRLGDPLEALLTPMQIARLHRAPELIEALGVLPPAAR